MCLKNENYILRRYQSTRMKAKIQGERIKGLMSKVDYYLNRIDKQDEIKPRRKFF